MSLDSVLGITEFIIAVWTALGQTLPHFGTRSAQIR